MSKNKPLEIDMCAGSELKDTQGETLSIEGADISDLEAGRGRFNDNHGKGFFNSVGRITGAKKIFKAEDCETDRQKYYWEKIKAPYIYVRGKLYNDEDHPNAKAAAAIMRNIHREDAPLAMKASVEGGVISRGIKDSTRLARTKIHSVALTFTPANNATLVEPLNLDKSDSDWEADKQLIKSVMHLAQTDIPSFRHVERHASANTIHENIQKIQELAKTIGVDIEIKESDPSTIMNQAVLHKIHDNVNKINEIVKAFQDDSGKWQMSSAPKAVSPNVIDDTAVNTKEVAADAKQAKFQQGMKQLKTAKEHGSSTPVATTSMSTSDVHRPVSGVQHKANVVIGRHAKKATSDPAHLDNIHSQIKAQHGADKANAVITKLKQKMQKSIKDSMIKALTAGYGGAGAPGNLSGGGVIQSEALDDGRTTKNDITSDGISYISCNDCGTEQVHMKHQVKCRSCNKPFSLSKLEDLI